MTSVYRCTCVCVPSVMFIESRLEFLPASRRLRQKESKKQEVRHCKSRANKNIYNIPLDIEI